MQRLADGKGVTTQPYESPNEKSEAVRSRREPLPNLVVIVLGFMFCLFCHAVTTFALFSYIGKAGGPTSKALDSVFFGYAPIVASMAGCLLTIALVSFGQAVFRHPSK